MYEQILIALNWLNLIEDILEHEKLKRICDEIKMSPFFDWWQWSEKNQCYIKWNTWECVANVREIIFTSYFMDKLRDYSYDWWDFDMDVVWMELYDNLHDPVTYLYNLLFNK